jgi:hypothetical protein
MNYSISRPNENGYIKISLIDTNSSKCGYILFRIQDNVIGLAMISCDCPKLKGQCMKLLLRKMIDYIKMNIVDRSVDTMRVELMVEPDEIKNTSPKTAIAKLKTHYRKYGFENDPTEPGLTEYMISTIQEIKNKINYNASIIPKSSKTYIRKHSKTKTKIPIRKGGKSRKKKIK